MPALPIIETQKSKSVGLFTSSQLPHVFLYVCDVCGELSHVYVCGAATCVLCVWSCHMFVFGFCNVCGAVTPTNGEHELGLDRRETG